MAEPIFEPMLRELRDVIDKADPVPAEVVTAAKAAFIWHTIDAELAELINDSLAAGAGVRSTDAARLLTFEGPGVEVEVEVVVTGVDRRLTGQLVPASAARVVLQWAAGSVEVTADRLGRFTADAVPAGSIRIEIHRSATPRPVVTSWVSI